MDKVKVLIDEETVQKRIKEIANQIEKDYAGKEITFLCILKGSVFFTTELSKRISNSIKLEFIRVSSYGTSKESSGNIEVKLDLRESLEGKDVIIIEDIIDTGRTLSFLKEYLKAKNPNSVKICTLLDKKERRVCTVDCDYVAFDIPDKFIVGYGLDFNEQYRNLPYVGYLDSDE